MADSSDTAGLTLFELSKSFGAASVLTDVSLRVARGEVVALVGPNGAGKTTLLRLAAGLGRPTTGRILVDGVDLARSPAEAKRKVGFAGDRPLLYEDLSAQENLKFFGRLYGLRANEAAAASSRALAAFGLAHRAADTAGTLSHGMRQRLSLARALLHEPSVLLLDEPFEGLDPGGLQAFVERLRDEPSRTGRAVLLVTHQVDVGLSVCDRAAIIDRGRLVKVVGRGEIEPGAFARELRGLGGASSGS